MRISATGKAAAGYTLLEVLAVLLLIGLICALARPEMFLCVERNRVRLAGKLVQTDLERVRAEAKTGNEVKVTFNPAGYCFTVGSTVITRDFKSQGLQFQVADSANVTVRYSGAGANPATTLDWKSQHYQGTLTISPTGAVQWSEHDR
jgi:prepilin-type N-terminal cleavage/methylation domain-containing protein